QCQGKLRTNQYETVRKSVRRFRSLPITDHTRPRPNHRPQSVLRIPLWAFPERTENLKIAIQDVVLFFAVEITGLVVEHSAAVNLWWREMCALDCVFSEQVPKLWSNVLTKTVLTAKCTPPKQGKHQPECLGAANIVMEYSEKRLNEGVSARLEQNREQYESLLQRSQQPPPLQLCQSAVHLETLITLMIKWYRASNEQGNNDRTLSLLECGRHLFYHIAQLTSEDTTSYPPAKQLITFCAEILGQEFLRGHADCQELLISQVFEWGGQLGGLLAPHLSPGVTPTHKFLLLYSSLSPHATTHPDHTFMLLSKFDLETWLLDRRPSCSEQGLFINAIGAALTSLLTQPKTNMLMVLELYRVHLKIMLNYKFPEHYMEILKVLLDLSAVTNDENSGVSSGLWYDLMNSLAAGITTFGPDMAHPDLIASIRKFVQHQTKFSPNMVKDTLKMLSNYFVNQRLENGMYGLYSKYRLHSQHMAIFLAIVSHSYIIVCLHNSINIQQDQVVREVWGELEGLWAGWVAPLGGRERQSCPAWLRNLTLNTRLLLPWSPADVNNANTTVSLFAASIAFMHDMLPGSSSVLSLVVEYYGGTFASREVKEHVLAVVHTHLGALSWHHLRPTLTDVLTFTKIVEQYLPECHNFIGGILVQINWKEVVAVSQQDSNNQVVIPSDENCWPTQLHTCLLKLLVRISMEPSVRQSSLLQTLLLDSEQFSWQLIDGVSFENVINWWVMSCDPRIVLDMDSRNPVDIAIIQLKVQKNVNFAMDIINYKHSAATRRAVLVKNILSLAECVADLGKSPIYVKPQVRTSKIVKFSCEKRLFSHA
ncbi:unnamed protein product, partial [Meganyctiphanes norvegica]